MISASEGGLDQNYLQQWATRLGVSDLLGKALQEAQ
jgi:hypothetical protein